MCLSGVPWLESYAVFPAPYPFAQRLLERLHVVEPWNGDEVEAVEAFDCGEVCRLDGACRLMIAKKGA